MKRSVVILVACVSLLAACGGDDNPNDDGLGLNGTNAEVTQTIVEILCQKIALCEGKPSTNCKAEAAKVAAQVSDANKKNICKSSEVSECVGVIGASNCKLIADENVPMPVSCQYCGVE